MKKQILSFVSALFLLHVNAQEALWWKTPTTSPEINSDNTVTFRLKAPKASRVVVTGDFLPKEVVVKDNLKNEVPGKAELVEGENGIWEYTTPNPLSPELYSYSFIVDGLKMTDPSNVYTTRDVVTMNNIFLVDGESSKSCL